VRTINNLNIYFICTLDIMTYLAQLQESNLDFDGEYAHYFHTWPGMLSLYERHQGFRMWLREKEYGIKRDYTPPVPFSKWVESQLYNEYPFIDKCK
jgi:hypothetical protein